MTERRIFFNLKLGTVSAPSSIMLYENANEGLIHIQCEKTDIALTPLNCELIADAFIRAQKGGCRYPTMETSAFFTFDRSFGNRPTAVRISVGALNSEASLFKVLISLDDATNMAVGAAIFTSEAIEIFTTMLLQHKNLDFLPSMDNDVREMILQSDSHVST